MKKISEFTLAGLSAGILALLLAVVGAARAQTPAIPLSPSGGGGTSSTTGAVYTGSSSTTGTMNTTGASTSSNAMTPGSMGTGTGILSPAGGATTNTTGASTSSNAITPGSSNAVPAGNASGAGSTTSSTSSSGSVTSPMPSSVVTPLSTPTMPMVVTIGSTGNILLRGIVAGTTVDSVMIQSWDGQWTVHVGNNITVAPLGTGSALSGIAIGDYVGVLGTVAGSQPLTAEATYVRDWTKTPTTGTGSPSSSSSSLMPSPNSSKNASSASSSSAMPTGTTLYTGTVTDVGANTLTITSADGATSYTVAIGPSTTVWNTARSTIALSSIQTGDSVRIDGTLSGATLTAAVLRDTSR